MDLANWALWTSPKFTTNTNSNRVSNQIGDPGIPITISMYGYVYIYKVKVSPLQAMKAHGDVDARVHIFTATALGRGRVASPTPGRLYPGTHFMGI